MAAIGNTYPTLFDVASRTDPDGKISALAELLSQENEVLEDVPYFEGNLPTGHKVSVRTGLPDVYWRSVNSGVPLSKSTSAQVTEECSMLEARSHIDIETLRINGNSAEYRLSEDIAFIESMAQRQAETLIYGNPHAYTGGASDPRAFTGLATRYSSISGASNGQNILDAGGTTGGQLTSVYLVVWGPNSVFGMYPKGSVAGLNSRPLGEESVQDAQGNWFQAERSLYTWHNGLVVKDWRYVVRIANIDTATLAAMSGTQALSAATNIIKMLSRSIDRIPNFSRGRAAFYANRTVRSHLRVMALEKSSNVLSIEPALNQFGNPVQGSVSFQGIPIRLVDRILNTEGRVT